MALKKFYVGVKAVIEQDGKILLLKPRGSSDDYLIEPGGRIDDDETIEQALKRELDEELPTHRNAKIGELLTAERLPRDIDNNIGLMLLYYRVTLEFPDGISLSDEHDAYEWLTPSEIQKRGSPATKAAIQRLYG